ncbi:MAG: energy transducer TonB [Acidobacteria bacterium]|nr:energy transducer TonB [Acidobacteriota bacterium]
MKTEALTRLALALLTASLCARAAATQDATPAQNPTQTPTPEWVAVSPAGEEFKALMPKAPLRLEQEVSARELPAAGQRYMVREGGARYFVWSLRDTQDVGSRLRHLSYAGWAYGGQSHYLDLVAELAWELLVRPELERLEAETKRTGVRKMFGPSMALRLEFDIAGRPAREYTVRLEREGGPVYVCDGGGGRVYVVAALAADPGAPDSKRFVESFAVKDSPAPAAAVAAAPASGVGDAPNVSTLRSSGTFGTPANSRPGVSPLNTSPLPPVPKVGDSAPAPVAEENRPLRQAEVTRKALITAKPEPGFTESARKFDVTGVVRLRAVLSRTGEVTNISVVRYLPHGLTERAIEAAKRIKFTPAQKDGRPVSQYVVLEYNFNIY